MVLLRISLPAALYAALYAACSTNATPLPLNSILPSEFVLCPLITPPPPPGVSTLSHVVKDSYLIVLHEHADHVAHYQHVEALHSADTRLRALKASSGDGFATAAAVAETEFEGLKHKYEIGRNDKGQKAYKGYAGKFSESVVDAIRAHPEVKYVERDSIVWASEVEKGAPWGLARISHRGPLSFGTFNRYEYDGNGGKGVDAYVIDTGVNIKHVELEGRAKWGKTIPTDPDEDLNGHGSHVAGTMASKTYGVAKQANIIAVKVLGAGGSGTMADVVAGVAWAADAAYAAAKAKAEGKNPKHKGSVANMSLGGGKSHALDSAVDAAVDDGLHFAVAAGNDNKDACAYSPAASVNAITVGASTIADERAYFSNHGKCVDILAPGLNILSIWNTGNYSLNTISGTSMASPHVAGLAAYFLSLYPESFSVADDDFLPEVYDNLLSASPSTSFLKQSIQFVFGTAQQWAGLAPIPPKEKVLSPKALKKALAKVATKGALTDLPAGTPNLLIFNNFTTASLGAAIKEAQAELNE